MTPEIDMFFRQNDPTYREGYEDGFNSCKGETIDIINNLLKKIKKLEAYRTVTTTVSTEQL